MHKEPILISDCSFSYEILAGYQNVKYFNPFNSDELMTQMLQSINS